MKKQVKLMLGDNMDSLKKLPDNSIDSIVSDPPYGLSFMGKKWDYDVPSVELWKEVYRVLKPGGHLLSFGGTRTYHRMVVNIEDAGFEIRDQIQWLYGSGFPKSHNIGKAVDKVQGNEREVIGTKNDFALDGRVRNPDIHKPMKETINSEQEYGYKMGWDAPVDKGNSPQEGWGTALKPANEPICVARKPISEKTVAANVLKWGTGGINVDGCRIGTSGGTERSGLAPYNEQGWRVGHTVVEKEEGRFPANIIFDESAAQMLDEQSGFASRFFYVAKVSKQERNMGLNGFEEKKPDYIPRYSINDDGDMADGSIVQPVINKNIHPTLKPVQLMSYLVRLVTPPGGIVLDPFMGSGSTGISAQLEGFRFVGMEMDADYFKIAEARIAAYEKYRPFVYKKKKK